MFTSQRFRVLLACFGKMVKYNSLVEFHSRKRKRVTAKLFSRKFNHILWLSREVSLRCKEKKRDFSYFSRDIWNLSSYFKILKCLYFYSMIYLYRVAV